MAKQTEVLTARTVAGNLLPGRYADGSNLYLIVSKTGAKSWQFFYKKDGKRTEMGLGSAAQVSLKSARQLASDARELLGRGLDPIEQRRSAAAAVEAEKAEAKAESEKDTFGVFALKLLHGFVDTDAKGKSVRMPGWADGFRNEKHIAQWETTLTDYCVPIWKLKLDEIEVEDVLGCLQPIWLTKNETASRLRGRIEKVLAAATVRKMRRGPNPATWQGNLKELLPRRTKLQRGHHPALPWADISLFWKKLEALDSVSASALAFTILTAARSGESRNAKWSEIDRVARTWTVPAVRMKAGKEHVVPLSDPALAILDRMLKERVTDMSDEFVFPSVRNRTALSDMALSMCLRGIQDGVTVHGFRSTFRDWAGDATPYARELVEQALAHIVGGVEGAYRRGTALEKRRALMRDWANFVVAAPACNVVPIAERATA
ncbi:tyrosine-type recombinase/integrase [Agrobacterium sp. rho-8.1]|nr:integrase arm-type DNA-binding domain-containing protein [Agrobacterium sp. rho-8.1]